MIKFNWEVIQRITKGDIRRILDFFENVYVTKAENYLYLNKWASRILKESEAYRPNYIQNVAVLLDNISKSTDSEIYVYLDLASKRSYFTFLNTKKKVNYLPVWKVGDYNVETLKMNRLLSIEDNKIYLIYEGD